MKYGRYIEELEKDVAILKSDSHPPIFTRSDYKNILEKLDKIENKGNIMEKCKCEECKCENCKCNK